MIKRINRDFYCLIRLAKPLLLIALCLCACNKEKNTGNTVEKQAEIGPKVLDKRLQISLFAETPDIVTPIGIAIDSLNRVFVLESHTHLPPKDYAGPDGDLIKVFVDNDADGRPDKISVFAEGLKEGLNIAFSPEGHLYVVTSRAVWVLYDHNNDGVCEEKQKVVELTEPQKVYAHAALLGIAFSHDGWMYISRGNTGSAAWKMQGIDASSVSGYGDGGNIVRARPDGSGLEEVATGFWNPMDLKFDRYGRLLAADNDPDSRGPNRLLHIVPGGDYGYQSRYGGSGIHPYLAWNGELPGTLPYAVELGEAPSGLLDASLAALPADYTGQMLCTVWEESRIVRIALSSKGVSVTGNTEVIVEGDQQFRPVALAADRQGNIYFTDWVKRDYPNHGKGRIWKLSARKDGEVIEPRLAYTKPLPNPQAEPLQTIYESGKSRYFAELKQALQTDDPFLKHAAVIMLAAPTYYPQLIEATRDNRADVRLGALLALQKSGFGQPETLLRRMLSDPDVQIRQRALIWAGQGGMFALKPYIDRALSAGEVTTELFETYLETVVHLMPEYIQAYHARSQPYAKSIERSLPSGFIVSFIRDKSRSPGLRALAIRHLEKPGEQTELLLSILTKEKSQLLRLEVLRALANIPGEDIAQYVIKVASSSNEVPQVRAWALLALTRQPVDVSASVIPLLQDPEMDVKIEAARYLRTRLAGEKVKETLRQTYDSLNKGQEEPLREQIALALLTGNTTENASYNRPASPDEWQKTLAQGGEPQRGLRVLYAVQSMCTMCHKVEGTGGNLGPDLTNAGLSKTRTQLIQSILKPSEEISPEYQGWYVRLKNGEEYQGRQIDVGTNAIELFTQARGFVSFDNKDVEDYGMSEKSLMPDGLENQLTVSDLRDLIAFLEKGKEAVPKRVAQIKK
jgi:putative membrane-bound dehydrogenase-like protein